LDLVQVIDQQVEKNLSLPKRREMFIVKQN